jgi:hypothetical protein
MTLLGSVRLDCCSQIPISQRPRLSWVWSACPTSAQAYLPTSSTRTQSCRVSTLKKSQNPVLHHTTSGHTLAYLVHVAYYPISPLRRIFTHILKVAGPDLNRSDFASSSGMSTFLLSGNVSILPRTFTLEAGLMSMCRQSGRRIKVSN